MRALAREDLRLEYERRLAEIKMQKAMQKVYEVDEQPIVEEYSEDAQYDSNIAEENYYNNERDAGIAQRSDYHNTGQHQVPQHDSNVGIYERPSYTHHQFQQPQLQPQPSHHPTYYPSSQENYHSIPAQPQHTPYYASFDNTGYNNYPKHPMNPYYGASGSPPMSIPRQPNVYASESSQHNIPQWTTYPSYRHYPRVGEQHHVSHPMQTYYGQQQQQQSFGTPSYQQSYNQQWQRRYRDLSPQTSYETNTSSSILPTPTLQMDVTKDTDEVKRDGEVKGYDRSHFDYVSYFAKLTKMQKEKEAKEEEERKKEEKERKEREKEEEFKKEAKKILDVFSKENEDETWEQFLGPTYEII